MKVLEAGSGAEEGLANRAPNLFSFLLKSAFFSAPLVFDTPLVADMACSVRFLLLCCWRNVPSGNGCVRQQACWLGMAPVQQVPAVPLNSAALSQPSQQKIAQPFLCPAE
ncbi:hypothetical protein ElyMa_006306500 [Elysia marginata]|uniref:Uncharacterized protein n=1 Tax=Elysia marginata TaxID=1093978 RepID=A0AAV4HGS0_9GAST|nr:hypothetical protein ElyMa_006306500 [Elysia marginata]